MLIFQKSKYLKNDNYTVLLNAIHTIDPSYTIYIHHMYYTYMHTDVNTSMSFGVCYNFYSYNFYAKDLLIIIMNLLGCN